MATEIVEYRHNKGSAWVRSAMSWTYEDLQFFNKICGWEKYRVRYV